ncbi:hypothetical protein WS85_12895 [Burkholderia anthina]|uniref:hypothetical protein n=1 Tax=Burkholderia anthina TaxID=179879 RepID=UPI0007549A0B|nr:hypothetical protein [Burkholderia anthina]KVH12229.1 hypothetical protein WS85_12895 [Burkholderia anthina]KVX39303.1 hypothetical protein WT32_06780 [Burkholderia anthina]
MFVWDLNQIAALVAVIAAVLGVLGTIFGWFGKAWTWVASLFSRKPPEGIIRVPTETLRVIPYSSRGGTFWHMGASGDKPIMQIVARVRATNIYLGDVHIVGAKLKKPKAMGSVLVRQYNSNVFGSFEIFQGEMSDVLVNFWVQPPVLPKGRTLKARMALIDQFNNEHWADIEFPYQ